MTLILKILKINHFLLSIIFSVLGLWNVFFQPVSAQPVPAQTDDLEKQFEENIKLLKFTEYNLEEKKLLRVIHNIFETAITKCDLEDQSVSIYYILKNEISEKHFQSIAEKLKISLDQRPEFKDYTDKVDVSATVDKLIAEIQSKNYFSQSQLFNKRNTERVNPSKSLNLVDRSSVYVVLLKDYAITKEDGYYLISLVLINGRTGKSECSIAKKIFITDNGKNELTYKIDQLNFEVEEVASTNYFRPDDNFFSINTSFTGNLLSTSYRYQYDSKLFEDGNIFFFSGSFEYDRRIFDTLYIGFEGIVGSVYVTKGLEDAFPVSGVDKLIINGTTKLFYLTSINQYRNVYLILGVKFGYLNIRMINSHEFDAGGILGFHFGYFKLEFAYPFPWITVGFVF